MERTKLTQFFNDIVNSEVEIDNLSDADMKANIEAAGGSLPFIAGNCFNGLTYYSETEEVYSRFIGATEGLTNVEMNDAVWQAFAEYLDYLYF